MDGQMFFKTLLQSKSTSAPIQFSGGDETNSFPVSGEEVSIVTSSGSHDVGSSKLTIKNIANFGWEHKFYSGQIVAAHMTGNYVAYAITTPNKNLGLVRVVNRDTDDRVLVKGMKGPVKDLAFAHTPSEVIIGCVDTLGNLFVNRVTESSSGLGIERLLEVIREPTDEEVSHRLIWCPYLPDTSDNDDSDDDTTAAHLLLLTHGHKAEMWSIDLVVDQHGPGPLAPEDVTQGLLIVSDIGGEVTDAAFSPDGSALATACSDGQVKFYQVYMLEEGSPRCIHQWSPHGGKPVSSLFFLDDHSNHQPDVQFWKYAVTGCSLNSELKIWSCESWTCLQTVRLSRSDNSQLRLKSAMDPTARYLLLADIDNCLVYVMGLDQSDGAKVVSTSEFATPAPFLSLSCVSGGRRLVEQTTEGVQVSHDEDGVPGNCGKEKTVVRLFLIQPKSIQECSIIFEDVTRVGDNMSVDQQELGYSESNEETSQSPPPPPVSQSSPRPPDLSCLPLPPISLANRPSSNSDQLTEVSRDLSSLPLPLGEVSRDLSSLPLPSLSLINRPASNSEQLAEAASKIPLPSLSLTNRPASNSDQLTEAASKISLLSPDQFKLSPSQLATQESVPSLPDTECSTSDSESQVPQLEEVEEDCEQVVSGNSSPSREVANILSEDRPVFQEREDGEEESIDRTFEEEDSASPSPTFSSSKVKVNNLSSTVFPTPPALPLPSEDLSIKSVYQLENMMKVLQDQMEADRQAHSAALSSLERKLEIVVGRENNLVERVELSVGQMLDSKLRQNDLRSESITETLSGRLDQSVAVELNKSLPGVVTRSLDLVRSDIVEDMSKRMASVESQIEVGVRDSLSRVLGSQSARESIGRAVAQAVTNSLQTAINDSYKQAFKQQMVGFERALSSVLQQISDQFITGTREYEAALTRRLDIQETSRRQDITPLQTQMGDMKDSLDRLVQGMTDTNRQLVELGKKGPGVTSDEIRDIVRREVKGALDSQPASDGKGVLTEKQTIKGHIQAGRINEAFQTALSASDLQLVVFTCDLLNTTQVFNSATCPLSQSVLLSLIQQLSIDLGERTEIKHAYLHEAIVNLDTADVTTKVHIKTVLGQLHQSLQKYINANPNSKMTRNMKILAMAAESHLRS